MSVSVSVSVSNNCKCNCLRNLLSLFFCSLSRFSSTSPIISSPSMRVVIQKVKSSSVIVNNEVVSSYVKLPPYP